MTKYSPVTAPTQGVIQKLPAMPMIASTNAATAATNGRAIVVDSKVPLEAYLEQTQARVLAILLNVCQIIH